MRIVATALVLAALVAAAPVGATGSGLYGVVLRGPVTPVCVEDDPCTRPAAGLVLVFTRAGKVTRVTTRADGTYRVRLVAGWYAVKAIPSARVGTGLTPSRVKVVAGRMVHRDFLLDTGIQ